MPVDIAQPEVVTEIDEFDLDLRLGFVEIGDQPSVDIHASGSCTCTHNKSCTCASNCSCSCSCSCDCSNSCDCSSSCGCDTDDDDW